MTLTLDPVSKQWRCMAESLASPDLQSEVPEMSPTSHDEKLADVSPTAAPVVSEQPASQTAVPPEQIPLQQYTPIPCGISGQNFTMVSRGSGALIGKPTEVRRNPIPTGAPAGGRLMQNYASSMPVNISYVPTPAPPSMGNTSSPTITPGQASTAAP